MEYVVLLQYFWGSNFFWVPKMGATSNSMLNMNFSHKMNVSYFYLGVNRAPNKGDR